jgi:hypothetical protein
MAEPANAWGSGERGSQRPWGVTSARRNGTPTLPDAAVTLTFAATNTTRRAAAFLPQPSPQTSHPAPGPGPLRVPSAEPRKC